MNSPGLTTFGGAVGGAVAGTASLASLTKTTGTLAILSNDQILVSGNASIGGTLSVNTSLRRRSDKALPYSTPDR